MAETGTEFELHADGNRLKANKRSPITSGSVNVYRVRFTFSPEWDGLSKRAVFRAGMGGEPIAVIPDNGGMCKIPWETLVQPDKPLYAGVYGSMGGNVVLPTVWECLGTILQGASTGVDTGTPTPDAWTQLGEEVKKAEALLADLERYSDEAAENASSAAESEEQAGLSADAAKRSESSAADSELAAGQSAARAAESARTAVEYSGNPPVILGGTWWTWDAESGEYTDTGEVSKGEPGAEGPQGPAGPQGPRGPQGPSGPGSGDMLASVYDPEGRAEDIFTYTDNALKRVKAENIAFADGETFQQKLDTGELTGPPGADGARGEQGPEGEAGAPGAQGERGPQGPAGPNAVGTDTTSNITGLLKGEDGKIAQAAAETDYLTPKGAEKEYLKKSGGEVTGDLSLRGRLILIGDEEAADGICFQYSFNNGDPSICFFKISGDGTVRLNSVAEPKSEYDAANKHYVDESIRAAIAGLTGGARSVNGKQGDVVIGGTQILRGTNTNTPLEGNGEYSNSNWSHADSENAIVTAIDVKDAPNPNINRGWRIANSSTSYGGIAQRFIPLQDGREYTLSCYARGNGTLRLMVGRQNPFPDRKVPIQDDTWAQYCFTFTAGEKGELISGETSVYFEAISESHIEICGLKLELGNVATDWAPSPGE